MTLAYWCILIAGILPIATVAVAKLQPNYDNRDPRAWLEQQQGLRRRADYAHRNHFEAFPFFAAAVLVAAQVQAPQATIDLLAMAFIAIRLAYTFFYLSNRPNLRSLAFLLGYGCVIAMFIVSALK